MSEKKSEFIEVESVSDSQYVAVFGNGVDRKISKPNLFAQIKDESFAPFIYPTIELLQNADLEADEDSPTWVRCKETEYRLYQITNLAPGVDDIALDNGNTATYQLEYRDVGFVIGPAVSVAGSLAIFTDTGGAQLDDLLVPTNAGKALMQAADSASVAFPRKNADNTVSMLGASAYFDAIKQVSAVGYPGTIETASNASALAQVATDEAITPANLAALKASNSDVITGTDNVKYVTSSSLQHKLEEESAYVVENVAALASTPVVAGRTYYLKEYHAGTGVGGRELVGKAGSTTYDNIITFAGSGGYFESINIIVNEFHAGAVGDGVTDDLLALQRFTNYLIANNESIKLSANNFYISAPIIISGAFRSLLIEGAGTGNSQTASSGGTTIVTNGTYNAIVATFSTFANENMRLKGIGFYNVAQDPIGGGSAIKIIRGASNGRYISGFVFDDVFANGYAAMFSFQGMNTTNALLNYFGNVRFTGVNAQSCGIGLLLNNCTLNLLTMIDVLFFGCPYGGIRLERDGDVGGGNGKGSSIIASLFKCHMEDVGGMFRTQTTTTSDPTPTVLRSSISLYDFTHEACGATTGPTTGDPFQLGVDTDVYVFGHVVNGLSYLEDTLPTLRDTCTLTSESRMRAIINAGGKLMSPSKINTPTIRQTIADGANYTFTVSHSDALAYMIKSSMSFAAGQAGFLQVMHTGIDSVGRNNTVISSLIGAGITVTYPAGAATSVVNINVANATGFSLVCELSIENLSNSTITQDDI